MPQSFTSLHYHIIFATKLREPVLTPEIRPGVWEYLGGVVRGLGGVAHAVGGVADHVHLLVTLRQQPALAEVVREIKARSSKWVHDAYPDARVWWQSGYGAFSVSHTGLDPVRRYIETQEDHHRTRTFEHEFLVFLRKHAIAFDESTLWE